MRRNYLPPWPFMGKLKPVPFKKKSVIRPNSQRKPKKRPVNWLRRIKKRKGKPELKSGGQRRKKLIISNH